MGKPPKQRLRSFGARPPGRGPRPPPRWRPEGRGHRRTPRWWLTVGLGITRWFEKEGTQQKPGEETRPPGTLALGVGGDVRTLAVCMASQLVRRPLRLMRRCLHPRAHWRAASATPARAPAATAALAAATTAGAIPQGGGGGWWERPVGEETTTGLTHTLQCPPKSLIFHF